MMPAANTSAVSPADVLARFEQHDGTLRSMLATRVERLPGHSFIEFEGRSLTYSQFADRVVGMAAMLWSRGVRAGDRVALMSHNHPSIPLTLFALARLGAIAVPVNPDFLTDEARYVLTHADVGGIICSPGCLRLVEQACSDLKTAPWLLLNQRDDSGAPNIDQAMIDTAGGDFVDGSDPDRTCIFVYSSGTTGFPKGVMHAQRTFTLAGEGFVSRMHLQPADRLLCIMPMFHMNAIFYSLAGTLATGASLVLLPRFSASTFWHDVAALGVTEVNTVAAISNILMRRPRAEFVPEHRLRIIYGGPFSEEVYRVFKDEFKVSTLIEGYGMSEIPGVLANPVGEGQKAGSIGLPCQHPDREVSFARLRIVDDDFNDVVDDSPGHLLVQTSLVTQGYFREPELTASAFREGWFITGDMVSRDADGYYWFVARSKDIIRRRGENVSGAEIDRIVNEHPEVLLAAAIAVPSPLGEDDILVAVVAREGGEVTPAEIHDWCKARLARIKVPRYVTLVPALPQNRSFRVEKFKLKARSDSLIASAVDFQ